MLKQAPKFRIVDVLGTAYAIVLNMTEAWGYLGQITYSGNIRYRYVDNTSRELTLHDKMFNKQIVFKLIEV